MKTRAKTWAMFAILIFGMLLASLWPIHPARAAGPWYVAPGGSDGDDCLTPGTPCETINGAIGKATAGDTVYVAEGTYTSIAGNEVVSVTKSINLSGGWDVTFSLQENMSTVDGGAVRRGMRVNSGQTATVERFIIQNGSAGFFEGGGIYNVGTLTLNDSQVVGNYASNAAGIWNDGGVLTINNSQIDYNFTDFGAAGGIYNNGALTLNNSSVSHNSATGTSSEGGGIFNYAGGGFLGSLTLNNSIVSDNFATEYGGIYTFNGTLNMNNSTVSGNITNGYGGGIYNFISTLSLNNVTITDNVADADNDINGDGGGIYNVNIGFSGAIYIKNSILGSNVDNSSEAPDCWGELTSEGYNLFQNTTGCTIVGSSVGNLIGIDPTLGALQDNGGATPTHALLPGSPAIDAGNPVIPGSGGNACEATDQRGVVRPQFVACDMGAFELTKSVIFSNSNFSVNENAGTAVITVMLTGALTQTASVDYSTSDGTATAGGDYLTATGTLTFTPGTLTQTFTVSILDDLLIEGDETVILTLGNPINILLGAPNPATLTLIDDDNESTVQFGQNLFAVDENGNTAIITVTLNAVAPLTATVDYNTVDGTATAGSDYTATSGILSFAPGVLTQTFTVVITDDALEETDETVTVTLSNPSNAVLGIPNPATLTIIDNDQPPTPGPKYVAPGGDDSNDCLSPGTPCETINGAIGKATAGDTVFVAEGTYTSSAGSEVVLMDKDLTLSGGWDLTFITQASMSTIDGEGVRRGINVNHGGVTAIDHFIVQNGWTDGDGGGLYISFVSSIVTIDDSTVSGNTSQYFGGGIVNEGTLTLNNCIVSNNTAMAGHGGGISSNGTLTLTNSTVNNNDGIAGGGIINGGTLTLNNSTITGNTSQAPGGGIHNSGTLMLNNSTLSGNGSSDAGGGIYNYSTGTVTVANSTFSGNSSLNTGGGLENYFDGIVTITESLIFNNTSDSGGGINNNGTVTIVASEFTSNGGSNSGGAIGNTGTLNISQSTFSSNSAYVGGGIYSFNGSFIIANTTLSNNSAMAGGGIHSSGSGKATITNSTLSNNYSGEQGGGIANSIPFTITNSTLYDNSSDGSGGGLFSSSIVTMTLQNTILAGNTSVGTGPDCSGEITSQGYNLIQDTSGCTITGDTTGNLIGMAPNLGPLQDNGGATFTHALLANSPAIDAGNPATPSSGGNACVSTDQRGISRPQGIACDMGAFELEQPPAVRFSLSSYSINEDTGTATITVTLSTASALTATVDYTTSDGTANAGSDYTSSIGTLTFAPGVTTQTFTVSITDDALDESDETLTVILSNPVNAVLGIPDEATLTIVDDDEVVEFKVYLPLIVK